MFCRNCGKELIGSPELCLNCGASPLTGNSFCHGCGAPTSPLAEFCAKCGVKLAKVEGVVKKRSGKLTAGGILGIIAAVASLLAVILILAHADFTRILVAWALITLILIILGITGCSYALARKNFPFSLAGGVCAFLATIFSSAFMVVLPTPLGIAAIVLIALSRSDFRKE